MINKCFAKLYYYEANISVSASAQRVSLRPPSNTHTHTHSVICACFLFSFSFHIYRNKYIFFVDFPICLCCSFFSHSFSIFLVDSYNSKHDFLRDCGRISVAGHFDLLLWTVNKMKRSTHRTSTVQPTQNMRTQQNINWLSLYETRQRSDTLTQWVREWYYGIYYASWGRLNAFCCREENRARNNNRKKQERNTHTVAIILRMNAFSS